MTIPKQTDPQGAGLPQHIRGYGCLGSTLAYAACRAVGIQSVSVDQFVDLFRRGIQAGVMLDDNNPVDHNNEDSWHRVEFQDSNGQINFIKLVARYFGHEVRVSALGSNGSTANPLKVNDIDNLPDGCNFVVAKYKDLYKHFVSVSPQIGPIVIDYNPDPSLILQYLISLTFYKIEEV